MDGDEGLSMEKVLRPRHFDAIIASVNDVCTWDIGDENSPPGFKVPSLALKLGHGLKKAAELALSNGIKEERPLDVAEITAYLTLQNNEWGDKVSHATLKTMDTRKLNTVDPLPLTEDLIKLSKETKEKMGTLVRSLSGDQGLRHVFMIAGGGSDVAVHNPYLIQTGTTCKSIKRKFLA